MNTPAPVSEAQVSLMYMTYSLSDGDQVDLHFDQCSNSAK